MTTSLPLRHHRLTIALHWMTFLVIVMAVAAVFLREVIDTSDLRLSLLNLHRGLGVCVLLLACARLLVRLKIPARHLSAGLPPLVQRLSLAAHGALYLLLLALPISGWLFSNAAGKTVSVLGLFNLPELIGKNRDLADQLSDLHETLAWVLIALIVAHVGAALWHHFWRQDHVLHAMLPARLVRHLNQVDQGLSDSIEQRD